MEFVKSLDVFSKFGEFDLDVGLLVHGTEPILFIFYDIRKLLLKEEKVQQVMKSRKTSWHLSCWCVVKGAFVTERDFVISVLLVD